MHFKTNKKKVTEKIYKYLGLYFIERDNTKCKNNSSLMAPHYFYKTLHNLPRTEMRRRGKLFPDKETSIEIDTMDFLK